MANLNLAPTPKATSALVAGALTTIFVIEVKRRFAVEIDASEAAAITTIFSFLGAYFAPRSKPIEPPTP